MMSRKYLMKWGYFMVGWVGGILLGGGHSIIGLLIGVGGYFLLLELDDD
jgi:hypothetical protein